MKSVPTHTLGVARRARKWHMGRVHSCVVEGLERRHILALVIEARERLRFPAGLQQAMFVEVSGGQEYG